MTFRFFSLKEQYVGLKTKERERSRGVIRFEWCELSRDGVSQGA